MKSRKLGSLAVLAALAFLGWRLMPERGVSKPTARTAGTTSVGRTTTASLGRDNKLAPRPRQHPPSRQNNATLEGGQVLALTGANAPSLAGIEVIDADEMEARIRTSTRFCTRAFNAGTTELRLIAPAEAGATATWEVVSGEVPEDAKVCLDEMLASLPDAISTSSAALAFMWAVDKVSPAKAYPYR